MTVACNNRKKKKKQTLLHLMKYNILSWLKLCIYGECKTCRHNLKDLLSLRFGVFDGSAILLRYWEC